MINKSIKITEVYNEDGNLLISGRLYDLRYDYLLTKLEIELCYIDVISEIKDMIEYFLLQYNYRNKSG
jgi:hypothetical protein